MGSGVGSAVAAGAAVAVGASAALGAAEDAAEPQADRETAQASARATRDLFIIFHILNKNSRVSPAMVKRVRAGGNGTAARTLLC